MQVTARHDMQPMRFHAHTIAQLIAHLPGKGKYQGMLGALRSAIRKPLLLLSISLR
jgi:hypothetical protein